ncbi:DUF4229 domain-containing protein [Streptomyces zingiberis]|uniref:DUF4229 domain-containing protein n=1 Tax=Streptomyces zingiberis TaxID=2053010 RepID=A0ABX1C4P7_9ACTN|nr:DUF4229 domain-containing protein [Streptomyces zingiberis]NJQ03761.1 DUF4229 domain-containing protein [Streptomyces zingiberis]
MSSSPTHAAIRYTAYRFGLFLACFLLAWGLSFLGWVPAGLGDSHFLWVVILGLVLSAPLSWVLLRKQREAMSEQVAGGVDRARQRLADNRGREDEADDTARAQG